MNEPTAGVEPELSTEVEPVVEEVSTAPASAPPRKSAEDRKAILAQQVAMAAAQGYRIESQSDFQAILIKGKPVRHAMHAIISLLTLVWVIGWIIIAITGGESREMIQVDEWGNITRQQL